VTRWLPTLPRRHDAGEVRSAVCQRGIRSQVRGESRGVSAAPSRGPASEHRAPARPLLPTGIVLREPSRSTEGRQLVTATSALLERLRSAGGWGAIALFLPLLLLRLRHASGQDGITAPTVRWHTSSFKSPAERRTTANEGDTVNLHLEMVGVTHAWLDDHRVKNGDRDVSVRLFQKGETATLSSDRSFPATVWMTTNKRAVTFTVPIAQDDLVEGTETASVCFEPHGTSTVSWNVAESCADIVIADDEDVFVTVTGGYLRRTVAEGSSLELELKLDKDIEREVNVRVTTTDRSTSADDYTLSSSQPSLASSQYIHSSPQDTDATRTRTITLQTTDDLVVEGDAYLRIDLGFGPRMELHSRPTRLPERSRLRRLTTRWSKTTRRLSCSFRQPGPCMVWTTERYVPTVGL